MQLCGLLAGVRHIHALGRDHRFESWVKLVVVLEEACHAGRRARLFQSTQVASAS
jgi:hypothetical protein